MKQIESWCNLVQKKAILLRNLCFLYTQGTPNAPNLSAAAIVLDRTISLVSILAIGFVVFMLAFGRQATKRP